MIDKKEIDLLINASIRGKKDLNEIPKTISDIEKAIDKQASAAKRGESSIDELKASMLSLKDVQSTLTGKAGLVGAFQTLGDNVAKTEEKVAKSTKAYNDFNEKLKGQESVTDAQQKKLIKLSSTMEAQVATLAKQKTQYAETAAALKEAGIETDNLAAAERQLRSLAADVGVVMQKNQAIIDSYSDTVRKAREEEKQRAADAVRNSKAQTDAATEQANRQKALDAAAKTAAEAAAAAKRKAADDQIEQQQRVLVASDKLAKALKEAEQAFASDNALVKQGQDAEKAAKGYGSLAVASADLTPKLKGLKATINDIINPSNSATSTLGGLESSVKKIGDAVTKIKGPVKDYKQTLGELKAVQEGLGAQSQIIDNFRKQQDALRAARLEYTTAKAEVLKYAAAVQQGGDKGASFSKALADAENRARAASVAMGQQITVLRASRQALTETGIAVKDLAASEDRLVAVARETNTAMASLTAGVDKYGIAVDKVRKGGVFGGGEGERTSLNFAQRLRGQILSLTAAYVGLFGAVTEAKAAIDAQVQQQTIESRIGVAIDSNDPQKIGKEYEYLRGRADYYGVGLAKLADSYGSYAIAAKARNFDDQQTKYTFEQLTAAMRVLKLNTDQQNRAFTQFNQILGKTKPELEDIKTIAESGFAGAQSLMAKGLLTIGQNGIRAGHEVEDMGKLMKKGLVDSGQLIYALAVQAEKDLGGRVPNAIKTLAAEQGRFETAMFEFQKAVSNSGWADAYVATLKEIQTLLASEDGAKAANAIGQAFTALAKVLIFTLENISTVKDISVAFLVVWAGAKFTEGIAGLQNLSNGVDGVGKSLSTVQKGFVLFTTFVAGWTIGTIIYDKFEIVRDAAAYLVTGLIEAWTTIQHSFLGAVEVLPIYFKNVMAGIVNVVFAGVKKVGGVFAGLASSVGLDSLADSLNAAVQSVSLTYESTEAIISRRRADLKKDLDAIRSIRKDMLGSSGAPGRSPPTAAAVATAALAGNAPTGRAGKPKAQLGTDDDKAANKRQTQIDEISKALDGLIAKTDKANSDSLAAQLNAVDVQYDALKGKIAKLGGKEGKDFAQQLAEGIAAYKGQITENFNKKVAAEQQALTKKLEDADAAAGRRNKEDLDARLKAVEDRYAETYRDIEAFRQKAVVNGTENGEAKLMKDRLDGAVAELKNLERKKFIQDEITRQETAISDLVKSRADRIKTVNDLEEAGLITNKQADEQKRAIIAELQPQIEALAASGQIFATSLDGAFDPVKVQAFVAQLNLAVASQGRLNKEFEVTGKQIDEKIANGLTSAIDKSTTALGEAIAGTKSWGEAISEVGKTFLSFAADFAREIALMILKQYVLNQLQSSGVGGGIAGVVNAAVKHSGGTIGGVSSRTRQVPAGYFSNAPRYHSGGVQGLKQDEYATILQKNEEVLAAGDPRNVMNMAASGKLGGSTQQPGQRFVFVDDRASVAEAMQSSEGEQVIVQAIRRNAGSVKQYLR